MSSEMNHAPYRDLLPQFAAGALSDSQRREVAEHLAGCDGCRAELAEWQAITGELRRGLADLPPDSASGQAWNALHARIAPISSQSDHRSSSMNDTIQTFSDAPVMTPPHPTRPTNRRRLGFLSVAAALLVVVMSIAVFSALHRTNTSTQGGSKVMPTSNPGCTSTLSSHDTLPQYTILNALSMVSPSEGWATGV
ncbi:MAG TPA: zf-HC2 domain-containing protein, partial [Ktedonobacterales bacterium]|nr:zf-HC2 domain-containing protein [Ktedonobacterales bacterium]